MSGRVDRIIDTVRDLFNESAAGFLPDEFILRSMNRCQEDLAMENYWRDETWIQAEQGVNRIDLLTAIPRFQDLHQVRFTGCAVPMTPLDNFKDYQDLAASPVPTGTPQYYVVQNNTLYVWPAPAFSAESGFCVYHSYLPEDLTCSAESPDPRVPRAHDMVYVYFVLKLAFLRDRHAPGADAKFAEYSRLYEMQKQSLLGQGDPPRLAVRPSR